MKKLNATHPPRPSPALIGRGCIQGKVESNSEGLMLYLKKDRSDSDV